MIYVCNMRGINKEIQFDEQWAIVRHVKSLSIRSGIMQHTALAPSEELLYNTKINHINFQEEYVPRFIEELAHREAAIQALNSLWKKDRNGKNIALICFCTDEETCHRSIVGGILQGAKAHVEGLTKDYSAYYDLFVAQRQVIKQSLIDAYGNTKEIPFDRD